MRLRYWLRRQFVFTRDVVDQMLREEVNPWRFDTSRYEQERFAKMLALTQSVPHERVLEVGCAEGHFTEQLVTVCRDVTAIDLSGAALARAAARVPTARFLHTTLEDLPLPDEPPYDVVICGEVLYYSDCARCAVEKLLKLGRWIVTSNCNQFALLVDLRLRRRLRRRTGIVHYRLPALQVTSIALWQVPQQR